MALYWRFWCKLKSWPCSGNGQLFKFAPEPPGVGQLLVRTQKISCVASILSSRRSKSKSSQPATNHATAPSLSKYPPSVSELARDSKREDNQRHRNRRKTRLVEGLGAGLHAARFPTDKGSSCRFHPLGRCLYHQIAAQRAMIIGVWGSVEQLWKNFD